MREKDHVKDPGGVDVRIILTRIFKKWNDGYGMA